MLLDVHFVGEDGLVGPRLEDDILLLAVEVLLEVEGDDPTVLDDWHRRFMTEVIEPTLADPARDLVRRHLDRGDLCAVVTATNDFVTAPIVRALGVEHLIATRAARRADGHFTGRVAGTPSFREGKIRRVDEWLASRGQRLDGFERSWFYSDSANDLPLLERVTDPVATNPDPTLRARATAAGWPVLELFA